MPTALTEDEDEDEDEEGKHMSELFFLLGSLEERELGDKHRRKGIIYYIEIISFNDFCLQYMECLVVGARGGWEGGCGEDAR